MEAVGAGLALVGFDARYGNPTFIKDGENGYLVPYSETMDEDLLVSQMADKIVFALESDLESIHQISYDLAKQYLKSGGEKIDSVKIDNSESNDDSYTLYCTVKTEKNDISYEKQVNAIYKKSKEWELANVQVNINSEWKITPLKGVSKKVIESDLVGEVIKLKNEEWEIEKGEISDLSIAKQETDLKNKRDKITVDITLDGAVEKAKGNLIVEYSFDKEWNFKGVTNASNVTSEVKEDKKLDTSEKSILSYITKQSFQYGNKSNGSGLVSIISDSTVQEIPMTESEISNFKIKEQSSGAKGTIQTVKCSATLTKKYVTFSVEMELTFTYSSGWNEPSIETNAKLENLDITGEWTGNYTAVGSSGTVSLNISEVNGDEVSGSYSYTPDRIDKYTQPGSYSFSGTIDKETLMLNLEAGEWISKPERVLSTDKVNIRAFIKINDEIMEGIGHDSATFKVSK